MKKQFKLTTLLFSIFILALTSFGVFAQDVAKIQDANEQPIYRLYNVRTSEHLYTADVNEYQTLSGSPDWNGEDIAWYAPLHGGTSVFRLYNRNTGFHLYTSDLNEMHSLTTPCTKPWYPDNMIGNTAYPVFQSGGSRQIYRLYNPGIQAHLLTADAGEYNTLAQSGWNPEGVVLTAIR